MEQTTDHAAASAPIPWMLLEGTPYEIGLRHGQLQHESIRAFLDDRLARINAVLPAPVTLDALAPAIGRYRAVIEARLPAMHQELLGLAQGAAISLDEALLLQLRRELVGYSKFRTGGDCTTLARRGPDGVTLAQTIDLNGDMERELSALRVRHSGSGRTVLLASFTGLLGYLGMNDRGLAIGLNLVLGGEWGPGIPGYMAIRHLLDHAASVDECLALLRGLPLSSSRSLTICDRSRLVVVEYIKDEMRVLEGEVLVHTNHFLDPAFSARDELNPFARTSSMRRENACRGGLARLAPDCPAERYFELLGEAPIYVPPTADIRRECTVGAVVMRPAAGVMTIRKGNPVKGASVSLRCKVQDENRQFNQKEESV
jgi:predicted choloylglycine hydrolase